MVILFTALVLGVTIGMGTMTCGWHFVDDHEILEWQNPLIYGEKSLGEMASKLFRGDYHVRFRPLYYPIRLMTILVLGNNLVIYEALKALQTVLCFILLYYVGRTCGGSSLASLMSSLLALTGYQAAAWWKLGPQELQGTMFFAGGMIALNLYLKNCHRRWAILSVVLFLIMNNWKESFIVLIPFVLAYVVYRTEAADREESYVRQLINRVRQHGVYLAALSIILATSVAIIIFVVGTNNSSGAGVSTSIGIRMILSSYQWAFSHDLKYYYVVTLVLLAVLLTYWTQFKAMWREILLFGIFILPNLVLYGKEAMAERYIIPSSIGYSLFFVVAVFRKGLLAGKRRLVYEAALVILFALGLRSTIIEADYYRYRGESVTTAMEYATYAAENDCNVVSCFGYSNPEAEWTMNAWMKYNGDLESLYYWDEATLSIYSSATEEDEKLQAVSLDDVDVIMAYNTDDRHYTGMCEMIMDGLLDEDFTRIKSGSVDIYVRNGVDLDLPRDDIKQPIYS